MWLINFIKFCKLGGINIFNNKFKDINEVYNIVEVKDEYILTLENNIYSKKYIYQIEPIILLDLCESEKQKIITYYKEFLRQINFEIQILIVNKEYDLKKYLNDLINSELKVIPMYREYIEDMENKFKKEKIFDTFFYIIVSIKEKDSLKVENVDNSLNILEKIGCKVERLKSKNMLVKILNKSINKEW